MEKIKKKVIAFFTLERPVHVFVNQDYLIEKYAATQNIALYFLS